MALNVTALATSAKKTTLVSKRAKRDLGPNPFLDPKFPFNLQNSYDNDEAYAITLAGKYVDAVHSKGDDKGKTYKRLTGDAADAVTLLREAAEKLGLGVSIPNTSEGQGTLKAGTKAGTVVVEYQAQKRKAARKPKPAAPEAPAAAPEAPAAALTEQEQHDKAAAEAAALVASVAK